MTTLPTRRGAVALVAAATAAAGLPLLLAAPASAEVPRTISVDPVNGGDTASAGTCRLYKVTPRNELGMEVTVEPSATLTVTLSESPNSGTQDVDFCTAPNAAGAVRGDRFLGDGLPSYTNAFSPAGMASRQTYTPGTSITGVDGQTVTGSTENPDVASMTGAATTAMNSNNPSGVDTAALVKTADGYFFGAVGLTTGAATINAFADQDGDRTRDTANALGQGTTEVAATARTLTFTAGGRLGSNEARDAVTQVTASPKTVFTTQKAAEADAATFTVTTRNASGNTVAGVPIDLRFESGPNAPTTTNATGTATGSCTPTDNEGRGECKVFGSQNLGDDQVTVFVNQTKGTPTANRDAGEPFDTVTVRTLPTPTPAGDARFLDLQPDTTTTPAGTSREFTAVVTDVNGSPSTGVNVVFTEVGPGAFRVGNGTSSSTSLRTGSTGRVSVTVTTTATESGSQTVAANISSAETMCEELASTTARAGNCTDTSTNTVTAAPSPTPTASATATASTSPSATATASASPSASATVSNSPSPSPAGQKPTLTLTQPIITSQESVTVNGTAAPGSVVELMAYSRPSTTYQVVRNGVVNESGTIQFRVGPSGNTRLFLRSRNVNGGQQVDSDSIVLTVRTSINLKVARTATRTYRFTGTTLPKRRNQLVTVFYQRPDGSNRVIAARARTNSVGAYNVTRRFGSGGTFDLFTGTGTDINNAAGTTRKVRTTIR